MCALRRVLEPCAPISMCNQIFLWDATGIVAGILRSATQIKKQNPQTPLELQLKRRMSKTQQSLALSTEKYSLQKVNELYPATRTSPGGSSCPSANSCYHSLSRLKDAYDEIHSRWVVYKFNK